MKVIRVCTVVMFLLILLIPLLTFQFSEDAVSLIDNRKLTANPFSSSSASAGGDLTDKVDQYISDRLGFRDDMILAFTVFNDRLFGKMVHPSYEYGKDGYVFGAGLTVNNPYSSYHEAFANMVKEIQDYCDAREIPFLFVFNPAKPAVLQNYLPVGMNYDRTWVAEFLAALDARQVRYIDNTPLLQEKTDAGEAVFNQKYDANHWNDLGAFYGTNAMLEALQQSLPTVHINTPDELIVSEKLQTSLPVSEFPIHEMVPSITIDATYHSDKTAVFGAELYRHPSYRAFGYYTNPQRLEENAPRALVFQGSYMNSYGFKYLANGFGEYIYVHDYENVLDFPYYFNIFQPDCVIFEVAEYTFLDKYFSLDKMEDLNYNPPLAENEAACTMQETQVFSPNSISIERGDVLTKIHWQDSGCPDYVWLLLNGEYDMKKVADGYEVTILSEVYDQDPTGFRIATAQAGKITTFTF